MPVEDEGDTDGDADDETLVGRPLDVNQAELLRATICVGKKRAVTMLREPGRRTSEVRGLAGLLDTYIAHETEGLRTSAFFDELDSREKASFSYRVGIGLTLLMAQRELRIPWLMHLEALLASEAARLDPEDASPTYLVGLSRTGEWHVAKARARSGEITGSIIGDAEEALRRVAAVNDRPPVQRRACVTALGASPVRVSFTEAEPAGKSAASDRDGDEQVQITVDPSTYITEYYAQFSFLTRLRTERRQLAPDAGCGNLPPAVLADLPGTQYEIGLLEPLHSALVQPGERSNAGERGIDEAVPREGWQPEDPETARAAGLSVGRDGVVTTGPRPPGQG